MTPYRLREILVYNKGAHRAVLMLKAYFDESGHSRDPKETVVAIGGCISTLERWTTFEDEWDELLHTFQVSWFHATELQNFKGDFVGWTEYRRRQFLQSAMNIMDRAVVQYVGAVVPLSEYEALTVSQKAQCPDPYYLCFQDAVHSAGIEAEEYGPSELIETIFSENVEMGGIIKPVDRSVKQDEGLAYRCYRACKRELPIRERLGPITFDSPRNLLPLQAADLVAYELLQVGRKMILPTKISLDKLRWPLQQIFRKGPMFHYYMEGELDRRFRAY